MDRTSASRGRALLLQYRVYPQLVEGENNLQAAENALAAARNALRHQETLVINAEVAAARANQRLLVLKDELSARKILEGNARQTRDEILDRRVQKSNLLNSIKAEGRAMVQDQADINSIQQLRAEGVFVELYATDAAAEALLIQAQLPYNH